MPEVLRTHPLSENRIADTRNRARQYPKRAPSTSLDYQLMRARVVNQLAKTPEEAIHKFRGELEGDPRSREAANYGLVLALTDGGRAEEASLELDGLWSVSPDRLEYIIADAEIDMALNRPELAVKKLSEQLALSPGNHPLTMTYANALMKNQQAHIAEEVLIEQSRLRPNDPGLWYLLAELQGLSGNIVGLHQSRAEYFILNGNLDQAEKQLDYALKLTRNDYLTSAKVTQRLRDINGFAFRTPVEVGQRIKLEFRGVDAKAFENLRVAYHRNQQDSFFRKHIITGVREHTIRRGESVWILSLREYDVPIWLFRQYNPELDLHRITPGVTVRFPILAATELR